MSFYLMIPRRIKDLGTAVAHAFDVASAKAQAGATDLDETFILTLGEAASRYNEITAAKKEAKAALSLARNRRQHLIRELSTVVRHFWNSLRSRTVRLRHDSSVLDHYGLERTNPNGGTNRQWIIHAEGLIAGEAKAVEKGFPAMSNPGVADLQKALEGAAEACLAYDLSQDHFKHLQQELGAHHNQMVTLMRKLARRLRLAFEDLEPSLRRELIRNYGLRFEGDPTQEEAEETPRPTSECRLTSRPIKPKP